METLTIRHFPEEMEQLPVDPENLNRVLLSGLFEVTDTGCVLKNIKNGIKTVVKYNTFLFVKTYAFETRWKRKLRKNCFLLIACVIRNINYCKT